MIALWLACAPAEHDGRPIAPVMSWWFADKLERPGRAAQEGTEAMVAALPIAADDVVLDLGCGTGFHARRLARRAARVLCVDLQPQMLAEAERLARAEGITNVDYVRGAAASVPVAAGTVDLALVADVYHELAEPDAMLASLRAALAPGGRVAVVEFRLEGDSAAFVKPEHRMAADQVIREWTAAGFRLDGRVDTLPTQHLLVFAP